MASVYLFAPAFGWLSDRKFGYIPVLSTSFVMYLVGVIPIAYTATAASRQHGTELGYLKALYVVGLTIVVLCASAVRATLLPYMLEQLGDGSESRSVIAGVIAASYTSVNIGAFAAGVGGGYLWQQAGICRKSNYTGFFWTYLLAVSCLVVAVLVLIIWRKQYRSHTVQRTAEYTPSFRDILATGCGCYRSDPEPLYYDHKELPIKTKEEETKDRLDEHRKRLGVLVPVLSTLILYYTVQGQLVDGFKDQTVHMNFFYDQQNGTILNKSNNLLSNYCTVNSTNNEYLIPPTVLNGFDALVIILTIPVVWWFIPSMYVRWGQYELTMLDRISIGMILTMLGCIATVGVEVSRIHAAQLNYICLKMDQTAFIIVYSTLSPFTQIPQHLLVGIGEGFTGIAAREFVLSRAPREFRCTAYGLIYLANGLALYLGGLLLFVMKHLHYYYSDISPAYAVTIGSIVEAEKSSRTWVYYIVLTAVMMVGWCVFSLIKRRHKDVLRIARAHIYGAMNL